MQLPQTLRARLMVICGFLAITLMVVGITGYVSLNTVSKNYDHVVEINLPKAMNLQQMSGATGDSIRQMVRLGYPNLPTKELDYLSSRFEHYAKIYDDADAKYSEIPTVEGETELHKKVSDDWKKTTDIARKMIQLRLTNDVPAYLALLDGDFRTAYNSHGKALAELNKFQNTEATAWSTKAQNIMTSSQKFLVIISLGGLIFGLGIAVFIAGQLQTSLRTIATSVSETKETVETASEQLNSASQQLANSSTEAAASLEETVASIEELTSMVKLNAGNALQASQLSRESQTSAVSGDTDITSLISAMSDINKSSRKIEEIISVIDDIAFQTNLLALNAAVEAARAGEQGKGFAVVAEAVRTLAQRSAQAAKEINVLIKDSVSQVSRGSEMADKSGTSLKEIVTSVKKVTDLNAEIATASNEQSEGIAQISKAMNQLDQATQSNAASAEEAAASSEVMLRQAKVLGEQVQNLMRIVG